MPTSPETTAQARHLRPEQYASWLRKVDDPEWTEHRYRDAPDRAMANAIRDLRDAYAEIQRLTDALAAEREKAQELSVATPEPGMRKVSETISYFQNVLDRFGDSCVYIRTSGVSWGAVALNRKHADKVAGDDSPEVILRTKFAEHAEYRERVGPIVLKELEARNRAETAEASLASARREAAEERTSDKERIRLLEAQVAEGEARGLRKAAILQCVYCADKAGEVWDGKMHPFGCWAQSGHAQSNGS